MDLFKKVFKRSLVGVMCLLSLLCSVPSFAFPIDKRIVVNPQDGVYRIKNVATGLYLSSKPGYELSFIPDNGSSDLEWIIQDTESSPSVSWYAIRPLTSPDLAVEFRTKDGVGHLENYSTDDKFIYYPNQRFILGPLNSGSYYIKSVAFGNNTDNRVWNCSSSNVLTLNKSNSSNNQKFVLEFVRAY